MELKTFIVYQLEEIKRELLDSIQGLTDAQLGSFSPKGHWPIAWIIQHCCEIYDKWLYKSLAGESFLDHEDYITARPMVKPDAAVHYPSLGELVSRVDGILSEIIDRVKGLAEKDFGEKGFGRETLAAGCYRIINHTNSHLRNIWFILGELNLNKWSEQKLVLPK